MTRKIHIAIAACAVVWASSGLHSALQAQTTVVDGVYTEPQAARGKTAYMETCLECHGEDLKGFDELIPPVAGEQFFKSWTGKTLGALYEQISVSMPALAPGSLKPEQVADLIAYMLSVSKYPVGAKELSPKMEELKQIKIGLLKQ
jgi:cytochrome c